MAIEQERRIETARQIAALTEQSKALREKVDELASMVKKLAEKVDALVESKQQIMGAVRMARMVGAAVAAALGTMVYLVDKLIVLAGK